MDYILICENCECRNIEIVEQNGEKMAKGIGEIYVGKIALELTNNRSGSRIFLKSSENVHRESMKKSLFLDESDKEICYFEFNESERENGEKVIKMQVQSDSSGDHYILICYNLSSHMGTAYLLPSFDELKRWAKELNICTYEILDSIGKFVSVENLA